MRAYSWDDWNVEHIAKHGVGTVEARYVVEHAKPPFPEYVGGEKWRVRGRTEAGRWLQVIYVLPKDEDVDPDTLSPQDLLSYSDGSAQVVYVVHARQLTDAEKRKARKRE